MPDLIELAATPGGYRLFNEFAFSEVPTRIPVFPRPGAYEHGEYGTVSLPPERLANFVTNFQNGIYQKHIPIDAEHETKLSGAFGYLTNLVMNDDGSVDAEVEWTDRGLALVPKNRFKYVSPEWYDVWQRPDDEVWFNDVLIGLALCSRPFFKDANGALRPLVAREGTLSTPRATTEGQTDVSDTTPPATVQPTEEPMSEPNNETVQMSEAVASRFAEMERRLTEETTARQAAEATATKAAEEAAALRSESRRKAFTDEVMGRSDASNIRWFGDPANHVAVMENLPDDLRQKYIEEQRANAQRVTNLLKASEVGSDAHAPEGSVEAVIAGKARAYAEEKSVTYETAYSHVLEHDAELRRRYMSERRTNSVKE